MHRALHRAIASFADQGFDLIVDGVLPYGRPNSVADALSIFHRYRFCFIGVHCDLDVLERRERRRADRTEGWARTQYQDLHDGMDYDIEVDTTTIGAGENADRIAQYLVHRDAELVSNTQELGSKLHRGQSKVKIQLREVNEEDIATIATMNRRLVEDERSRNPFSETQFRQRIAGWLAGDEWELVLFTDPTGTAVGYAVYRLQRHDYYRTRQVVYLRQFFIDRPFRGQGLGRAAYLQLESERFGNREVSLDVLTTNPSGRRFWERMGFSGYYVSMKKG